MAYKRWKDEPWATKPEVLLDELERVYRKAIAAGKVQTPAHTALKKAIQFRSWCASVPHATLLAAVQSLEMVYVPAGVGPGPAFLFPVRDVTGEIRRAHLRILDDSVYGLRYISLVSPKFIGPAWMGADDETLEGIIQTGEVMVMEGPFDQLAVRAAQPRMPNLGPLTKRLSDDHWDDLKMLGVKRIYVMFDNEQSKRGEQAADIMARRTDFQVVPLVCPAHDPSDALKHPSKFQSMQRLLTAALPDTLATATTFTLDTED